MTSLPSTLRDQELISEAQNYFRWQYELAKPFLGGRVLEIGCSVGNFTSHLLDRELLVCTDIEAGYVRLVQKKFGRYANVHAMAMDIASPTAYDLKTYDFDTIICLNVLEHIESDAQALRTLYNVLQPAGKLILIVPAFMELYGPIDRNVGHWRRYTRSLLQLLVSKTGFQIITMHYINAVGALGWWLNARVFKKTEQSELQIKIFDTVLVPLISRLERVCKPPLGQSIFAVLQKPSLS